MFIEDNWCDYFGDTHVGNKRHGHSTIEQTIVLYDTGSASLGIVRQVRDAVVARIDKAEATESFRLVDKHELVTREMAAQEKRPGWEGFAHDHDEGRHGGLLAVVKRAKVTVLIGTSTHSGGFTEDVIKALSGDTLPPSNPSWLVSQIVLVSVAMSL